MPDYNLLIRDHYVGAEYVFHDVPGATPEDAFENVARKHGLPGVDSGLPLSALKTELYEQYEYELIIKDEK